MTSIAAVRRSAGVIDARVPGGTNPIPVILDACFSGLVLESLPRERFHPPSSPSQGASRVLQVITAGTAGQTVADDGLFAELIAAGLTGAADLNLDGWISGTELGMYLRLRVTEESRGRQTPRFGNVIGTSTGFAAGENWFASVQMPLQPRPAPAPPQAAVLKAFRDCEDCPLLRVVPGPRTAPSDARAPYVAMGVREVTFEEYDACFRARGCRHWPWSPSGTRGQLPVTDVSWRDADEYTKWLSCLTGSPYRLPAESEWREVASPEATRLDSSVALPPDSPWRPTAAAAVEVGTDARARPPGPSRRVNSVSTISSATSGSGWPIAVTARAAAVSAASARWAAAHLRHGGALR